MHADTHAASEPHAAADDAAFFASLADMFADDELREHTPYVAPPRKPRARYIIGAALVAHVLAASAGLCAPSVNASRAAERLVAYDANGNGWQIGEPFADHAACSNAAANDVLVAMPNGEAWHADEFAALVCEPLAGGAWQFVEPPAVDFAVIINGNEFVIDESISVDDCRERRLTLAAVDIGTRHYRLADIERMICTPPHE